MKRIPGALALGAATIVGLASAAPIRAQAIDELDPETQTALAEIRAATEKYQDPEVALADGYVREPMNLCATSGDEDLPPNLGAMGIHYFRPDLLGITGAEPRVNGNGTHTDFLTPAILVYHTAADGSLKLGAVENLVWEAAWRAAGNEGPPEFHGYQYYHRIDNPVTTYADEAHLFEPHYELHIWLYEENPAGVFAQFNRRVSCEYHDGPKTMAEAMSLMQAAHTSGEDPSGGQP
jgi:hypothetical protein